MFRCSWNFSEALPWTPTIQHAAVEAEFSYVCRHPFQTLICHQHYQKQQEGEMHDVSVYRRVYVNRDENKQVARSVRARSPVGEIVFVRSRSADSSRRSA